MDEMKEIITERTVVTIINLFAIGMPLLGLIIGVLVGKLRHKVLRSAIYGLSIGMVGPVNLLMWHLYDFLTNFYGLDSVKGLLVNLCIFGFIGILLGIVLAIVLKRT